MHSEPVRLVVACMAYNHEKFIAKTLDSFIMQQVREPFHVYVHDDCSTDVTSQIIKEYQERYPQIIKATLHPKNYYLGEGIAVTKHFLFPSIRAQYVALCEGDDFFLSPHKLQKQLDFLDENPDYSLCFHQALRIVDGDKTNTAVFPGKNFKNGRTTFTLEDLLEGNFIQTNSCMYRWRFTEKDTPQKLIPDGILPCDHFWHLLHAECGKIGYIDEILSAYNIHSQGLWQENHRDDTWYLKYGLEQMKFFFEIEKRYAYDCSFTALEAGVRYILAALEGNEETKILLLHQRFPHVYDAVIQFFTQSSNELFLSCATILTQYKKLCKKY